MTAPRTALFQRKGAPPPMAAPADVGAESAPDVLECKACGAMLDPATGEPVDAPPADGGGGGGVDLAALMGGG